jgi:hypothetical protein
LAARAHRSTHRYYHRSSPTPLPSLSNTFIVTLQQHCNTHTHTHTHTHTQAHTQGFNDLLALIENTTNDSFDLYKGLYRYNPHSQAQLDAFQGAFEDVRASLIAPEDVPEDSKGPMAISFNPRVTAIQESKTGQVNSVTAV